MKIYLTRHGQKDSGDKKTKEEHFARSLTDLGKRQARSLAEFLKDKNIKNIYTSNMPRAIETSAEISKLLKVNVSDKSAALREADPCTVPGLENRNEIKVACWNDWNLVPEHGESYNQGKQRFSDYFWQKVEDGSLDNALVVCHGRVLRLFLSDFLEGGREAIKETYNHVALTELEVDPNSRIVEILRYNDNSFLPEELR